MKHLGDTRGCRQPGHLLHTPDTFVRAPLPNMLKATAIIHASPAIGAKFTQYSVEFEEGGKLGDSPQQRFVYVLEGMLRVTVDQEGRDRDIEDVEKDDYVYIPAGVRHSISARRQSRALVIEKPYQALEGDAPPIWGRRALSWAVPQPLLGDTGIQVRPLLSDDRQFDFAVNSMTFEPGAALPMVEMHVMEHGLFMMQGGGIYRLGDCWHPVTAGDFIWMAPYCPQWFCAVGKTPAHYLIYKDWNRYAD